MALPVRFKQLSKDLGDSLDVPTFEQILEMDDDEDDRDFSHSIVYGFFEQAEHTFEEIEEALKEENLEVLSAKGHFLKGSSATLGLTVVKQSCEKIQHWGKQMDETGNTEITQKEALANIQSEMTKLKSEYFHCEKKLKRFYE